MAHDPEKPEQDAVGYGKPPKKHQFKRGRSGNPKGRPKGPGSLRKLVAKHAAKKVTVIEGGVRKSMTKLDVMISAMFTKGAKGDVPAARLVTTLIIAAVQLQGEDFQSSYSEEDFNAIMTEAAWQMEIVRLMKDKEERDEL